MLPSAQALPEGRLFAARWHIVRCIQAGGMGTVYEVVHRETQARCALKVMLPELLTSAEMRARFRQEAMVTATIESDHIVKVFDGGTDAETGAPFLVMELLRGEDLAARGAERGPLPAGEVVALLRQAALALERTHAAGVVHRDLKPANLFLTKRDDGSPCLKVLDYGIAKIVASASRAETTRTLGTPLYMAPEQVKGDGAIAAAADLYALAQIAYTLLAGRAYWAEEQAGEKNVYPLLMAISRGVTEPASARAARAGVTLPPAFDAWFARAAAVAPDARFTGAPEMIDALAGALGVAAAPAREAASAEPAHPRRTSAAPAVRSLTVGGTAHDAPSQARRPQVLTLIGGAAALAAMVAFAASMRARPLDAGPEASAATAVEGAPARAVPAATSQPPAPTVTAATGEGATAPAAPTTSATSATATEPRGATAHPSPAAPARSQPAPSPRAKPSASAKADAPAEPPRRADPGPADPSDVYRGERRP